MKPFQEITEILDAGPSAFEHFADYLDAEWLQLALKEWATGLKIRNRLLPATQVIWLIIGMALFRNTSITEVVAHLGVVGPAGRRPRKRSVAPSSISAARDRLGEEPMAWLFRETGQLWGQATAQENQWHNLCLFAVDGTTLRVPDTQENRDEFGLPGSSRGQAGYPQVRVVALMAVRSHVLTAATMGPYRGPGTGEQSLARDLWVDVPDHSLTLFDKGFLNYGKLHALSSSGVERHWLVRAKDNLKWTVVRQLGAGDLLVEVKPSAKARKEDPSLPRAFICRAVCYQTERRKPQWVLTSLLNAEKYPAKEIARLYHERWEEELGYDEVKTHMLEREEALRSKRPQKVRQEIWGILLAYNLVRMKMMDVASKLGLPPTRLSFTHALRLVRMFCEVHAWVAAPTKLPRRIEDLEEMFELLILPERRTSRRYPRHVKIKMSKFKRNPGQPASHLQ
jgi:hypothetical protein